MSITFFPPTPQSEDGFYTPNNPYQINGEKGFVHCEEEPHMMFYKLDFPGIMPESLTIYPQSNQEVLVMGDAPGETQHESDRSYRTTVGLNCNCCVIFRTIQSAIDGTVRLTLVKNKINLDAPSFCSNTVPRYARQMRFILPGPRAPPPIILNVELSTDGGGLTILPHPNVVNGSTMPYEWKQLEDGGLFLRIDMPGVPSDNFQMVKNASDGVVAVMGFAPPASHYSSGRRYFGKVTVVPIDYDMRRIMTVGMNGVFRMTIPPV